MTGRRSGQRIQRLLQFDQGFRTRYGVIAGVDEVGRGPLAGPVVAAAVILEPGWGHPSLNDSKLVPPHHREILYSEILQHAVAWSVASVDIDVIDTINIRQASLRAMRLALAQMSATPDFVLVDGFKIPQLALPQTGIIRGDSQSAHIAAASILAKVTRDRFMDEMHQRYPAYGFSRHKGYGTPDHLEALQRHGPCPIHRRTFAPVRERLLADLSAVRE